ncbi:MAG: type I-E CRISPR-associated protein Cse2/CasB [Deltaproteobacteria bacterium]|nr:type I-E CRISPR-associated protein Cse2/CasB [Deltaproteobacteria bacterium]
MKATRDYIKTLRSLKVGDLGLLRSHAGQGLDESVDAFDLFAGLWWPLRQKTQKAPKREVAWLIAKLYAARPLDDLSGSTLARQLSRCEPRQDRDARRFRSAVDRLLTCSISDIEPHLRWALDVIAEESLGIDWVKLTDDLSYWQHGSKRGEWARHYLGIREEIQHVEDDLDEEEGSNHVD